MTEISRRGMIGGTIAVVATMVTSTSAEASKLFKVGNVSDFPAGTLVLVTIPKNTWFGKKKASLLSTAKGFFAYEATCTHEQFLLRKSGKKLVCENHGAVFNSKTGAALSGPARSGLTKFKVTVSDGVVYLSI